MRSRLFGTTSYLLSLSFIYLVLDIVLPVNTANQQLYHLTSLAGHVLQLVLALPMVAIWLAAFYGFVKLKEYADSLQNSKEAGGYRLLARGCMWLAWGKPVVAIISAVLIAIANTHAGFMSTSVVLINYIDIIVPLIAFISISLGSRKLLDLTKDPLSASAARTIALIFVVLAVVYCYLIFRSINFGSLTSATKPYYLPIWLIITTVTIPYLYTWLIGLLSVGEIMRYSQKIHGILYKHAVQYISVGIIAVIASAIAFQYVSSIDPALKQMSLDYLLISNYLIKLMGATGFVSIGIGAVSLKRIEDV